MSGRTALVTGGAGFIRSHLAESLLDQGWEVYALHDLSTISEANVFQPAQNPYFHLAVDLREVIEVARQEGPVHAPET